MKKFNDEVSAANATISSAMSSGLRITESSDTITISSDVSFVVPECHWVSSLENQKRLDRWKSASLVLKVDLSKQQHFKTLRWSKERGNMKEYVESFNKFIEKAQEIYCEAIAPGQETEFRLCLDEVKWKENIQLLYYYVEFSKCTVQLKRTHRPIGLYLALTAG